MNNRKDPNVIEITRTQHIGQVVLGADEYDVDPVAVAFGMIAEHMNRHGGGTNTVSYAFRLNGVSYTIVAQPDR